jgi:hypothetical protein
MLNLKKFTILDYNKYYKCVKICSITGKEFSVKLSRDEFFKYYLPKGKCIKHLTKHNVAERLFLETTLTPYEIRSIPEKVRDNLDKRKWRFKLIKN